MGPGDRYCSGSGPIITRPKLGDIMFNNREFEPSTYNAAAQPWAPPRGREERAGLEPAIQFSRQPPAGHRHLAPR